MGADEEEAAPRPPTGITANEGLPAGFDLGQDPNPFNPVTEIRYLLPLHAHVTLTVYNTLGQQVKQLVDGEMPAGVQSVQFDASAIGSGVYFYRMEAVAGETGQRFSQIRNSWY